MVFKILTIVSILIIIINSIYSSPVPYANEVIRCNLQTELQRDYISHSKIDIWSHGISLNHPVDLRVSPIEKNELLKQGITCSTWIPDLSQLITQSMEETNELISGNGLMKDKDTYFKKYATYTEIIAKISEMASTYPNLVTNLGSIGKTVEGRDIPAFKITNNNSSSFQKKSIWWNGGIHAREWISPAVVMYLANKLVTATDQTTLNMLNQVEIYITPISNPDGYVYTFTKDRMWRKNRSKNPDGSFGVDLNRNFDEHWMVAGASSDPSSETYAGKSPFSELETLSLSKFVMSLPNRAAGIDFHSYSQLVLRAWGWTDTESSNEGLYKTLGDGMSQAIQKQSGVYYTSEKGSDLYPAVDINSFR